MATSRTPGNGKRHASTTDAPLVAVVDDDASVRRSAARLICSFGFRAETFASGPEFLDAVSASQFCCLVLDVRMPGMDGLELQRHLAERGLQIPIVFLTGRASDHEERRARSAGAIAFLRKPVDTATLRQVLDGVCRRP
jgi:FixJ family two-component response regulator